MLICSWDTKIQSYPTSASKIKSTIPIVWPGHISTFCLWQMVEIFVVYSKNPKLKTLLFLFFKIFSGSWENRKKTPEKCDFWLSKPEIVGLATSILYIHGRCLIFLCYIRKTPNSLFYFSKYWFVAEIQGLKVTPLLHLQSKVPNVRPGTF